MPVPFHYSLASPQTTVTHSPINCIKPLPTAPLKSAPAAIGPLSPPWAGPRNVTTFQPATSASAKPLPEVMTPPLPLPASSDPALSGLDEDFSAAHVPLTSCSVRSQLDLLQRGDLDFATHSLWCPPPHISSLSSPTYARPRSKSGRCSRTSTFQVSSSPHVARPSTRAHRRQSAE